MCKLFPQGPEESVRPPGDRVIGGKNCLMWVLGSLQEQYVFLITEPSFQVPKLILLPLSPKH